MKLLRSLKLSVAAVGAGLAIVALFTLLTAPHSAATAAAKQSDAPTLYTPLLSATDSYSLFLPVIFYKYPAITYFDSFDNPASGWPIHSFYAGDPFPPGPYAVGYGKEVLANYKIGGENVYNLKTVAAWNSWVYPAPVVLADTRYFTIEVDGKSAQDFMWLSSWGIYFNANADRTKLYTVQIYQDGTTDPFTRPDYHVRRWDLFTGDAHALNQELDVKRRCGRCTPGDFKWNRIVVSRDGDWIYVYLGQPGYMQLQHEPFYAPQYSSSEYNGVGLFNGNFEWSDWQRGDQPTFQADNFLVTPAYYR